MAFPVHAPGPVLVADPTAVFGRRLLAVLIDAALVLIPTFLLLTATFEYRDETQLDRAPQQFCDDFMAEQGGLCVNFADVDDRVYTSDGPDAATIGYFWGAGFLLLVLLQGLTGWTIGKLVTGIRTVREDGRPPGIVKAFLRWILWAVDGQPCGLPLVGFITGLTTQGHRRVGDMVAKTFVVRASAAGAPIVVPGLAAPLPYSPATPWMSEPSPSSDPNTSGWAAPGGGASSSPGPGVAGPQWDPARNTYIQWDPAQAQWMQWDEAAHAWSPIAGQ